MKTRIFLLCMALSATAWGAEPAASNTAAPADTATAAKASTDQQQADTATPANTNTDQQPAATSDAMTTAPQAGESAQPNSSTPAANTAQKSADASAESGFSRGSVVRSVFTTGVKDKEPVNKLNNGKTGDDHIFYYTELRDMSGQTAVHRWTYKGKVVAEVKFNVRGPRWRVWSSKTIPTGDTGEWKVSVINGAGQVIAEDMIDYTGQPATQAPVVSDQPATTQQQPAAEQSAPAADTSPQQQPTTDQSAPAAGTSPDSTGGGNGGM